MRTNIEVDDKIIKEVIRLSGINAKNEAITKALENLLKYLRRRDMLSLRGKIKWEGDLDAMRAD